MSKLKAQKKEMQFESLSEIAGHMERKAGLMVDPIINDYKGKKEKIFGKNKGDGITNA